MESLSISPIGLFLQAGPVVKFVMCVLGLASVWCWVLIGEGIVAVARVDAPIREIAGKAGLGIGTVYRHFPRRSDLIAAVFRREIDECADEAVRLAAEHEPFEALRRWMQRFSSFFATKRGLAGALHSGDPAYAALPQHFDARLRPALERLLASAVSAGRIRSDVAAGELLGAVARLSMSDAEEPAQARRMVALLADGLRRDDVP